MRIAAIWDRMRRVPHQYMRVVAVVVVGVGIAVVGPIPDVVVVVASPLHGLLTRELVEIAGVARIVPATATCQRDGRQDRQCNLCGLLHGTQTKLTIRRCISGLSSCLRPELPVPRLISRLPKN